MIRNSVKLGAEILINADSSPKPTPVYPGKTLAYSVADRKQMLQPLLFWENCG